MDAFVIPLVVFTGALGWLWVEVIRGSFEDPYPLRAGVTWAVTCPTAGLLFVVGLAPFAFVVGTVSMLALGSLAFWFLGTEAGNDPGNDDEEPVEPDPGPGDDTALEIPKWAQHVEPESEPGVDWDEFDRMREQWEKELPIPATGPERELLPADG
jgi:hypothetical protein